MGVHGAVGWFQGWPTLSINRTFTRNWGCPREKKCQVSASSWNPVSPVWQHDLLMLVRHFYWWPVTSLCFLECDWWVGHCRQSHMPGGHTWIETGGANESSGCLVLVPRVQDTQSSSSSYPGDGGSVAEPWGTWTLDFCGGGMHFKWRLMLWETFPFWMLRIKIKKDTI